MKTIRLTTTELTKLVFNGKAIFLNGNCYCKGWSLTSPPVETFYRVERVK